ncbi:MAG: ABC transporter permease subunit [Anaerolineae bacterium]|uniref:ABC transporter permease subunit n=1 Tax=Promineifilum sp. TaxID=2664178 RepID=UPI001D9E2127|nr:ABC transporter permease subunit [Anaerolineales bacterium]MCB8936343.1 ABC transporter permease subunit [Promineifilum sp.]MCO5179202.1 ABC transporter permease [Promineifilum sp.]MCW5848125.1 ABC transporter permease subunit [Anaerolineae bacterium]
MPRLIWQELKFRRNAIIGWGLGLCFFPIVYIGIYPSVADQMASLTDLAIYQYMGMNLNTFGNWVGSILLVFMPLIASVYAIINSTGTLAGEEEDGRLEMMVTLPLPRWQIIVAKAIAISLALLIILALVAGVSLLVFGALQNQVETDVTGINIFMAVLSVWPLTFAMGMIGLFLAVFAPSRRVALMLAAAVLIIGYLGPNLAASTTALEPLEPFFLFSYLDSSGQAIREGQWAGDMLVLILAGLAALALAIFFFARRNLTVGVWPWQRPKVARPHSAVQPPLIKE